jgi:hypothetical protein
MVNKKYAYIGIGVAIVLVALFAVGLFAVVSRFVFEDKPYEETTEQETNFCTDEQREAEMCIELWEPVCGFREDGTSKTFSNSCFACMDSDIVYWIDGECSN